MEYNNTYDYLKTLLNKRDYKRHPIEDITAFGAVIVGSQLTIIDSKSNEIDFLIVSHINLDCTLDGILITINENSISINKDANILFTNDKIVFSSNEHEKDIINNILMFYNLYYDKHDKIVKDVKYFKYESGLPYLTRDYYTHPWTVILPTDNTTIHDLIENYAYIIPYVEDTFNLAKSRDNSHYHYKIY